MRKYNQKGFSHLVLVLFLVLVLGVIGFAGYRVVSKNSNEQSSLSTDQKSAATQAPEKIQNSSDLSQAQKAVEQTDVEGDLNPADLNSDANALQ